MRRYRTTILTLCVCILAATAAATIAAQSRARRPLQATDLDAIVYRSRTTPEASANFAFFAHAGFAIESWAIADRTDILTDLVLRQGFTVSWDIGGI